MSWSISLELRALFLLFATLIASSFIWNVRPASAEIIGKDSGVITGIAGENNDAAIYYPDSIYFFRDPLNRVYKIPGVVHPFFTVHNSTFKGIVGAGMTINETTGATGHFYSEGMHETITLTGTISFGFINLGGKSDKVNIDTADLTFLGTSYDCDTARAGKQRICAGNNGPSDGDTLSISLDIAKTLSVSGFSQTNLTGDASFINSELGDIDLLKTTGNTLNLTNSPFKTLTGTSATDTIILTGGTQFMALNTGAGADVLSITGDAKFTTIDAGAGTDNLTINAERIELVSGSKITSCDGARNGAFNLCGGGESADEEDVLTIGATETGTVSRQNTYNLWTEEKYNAYADEEDNGEDTYLNSGYADQKITAGEVENRPTHTGVTNTYDPTTKTFTYRNSEGVVIYKHDTRDNTVTHFDSEGVEIPSSSLGNLILEQSGVRETLSTAPLSVAGFERIKITSDMAFTDSVLGAVELVPASGGLSFSLTGVSSLVSILGSKGNDTIYLGFDLDGNAMTTAISFNGTAPDCGRICGGGGSDMLEVGSEVTLPSDFSVTGFGITNFYGGDLTFTNSSLGDVFFKKGTTLYLTGTSTLNAFVAEGTGNDGTDTINLQGNITLNSPIDLGAGSDLMELGYAGATNEQFSLELILGAISQGSTCQAYFCGGTTTHADALNIGKEVTVKAKSAGNPAIPIIAKGFTATNIYGGTHRFTDSDLGAITFRSGDEGIYGGTMFTLFGTSSLDSILGSSMADSIYLGFDLAGNASATNLTLPEPDISCGRDSDNVLLKVHICGRAGDDILNISAEVTISGNDGALSARRINMVNLYGDGKFDGSDLGSVELKATDSQRILTISNSIVRFINGNINADGSDSVSDILTLNNVSFLEPGGGYSNTSNHVYLGGGDDVVYLAGTLKMRDIDGQAGDDTFYVGIDANGAPVAVSIEGPTTEDTPTCAYRPSVDGASICGGVGGNDRLILHVNARIQNNKDGTLPGTEASVFEFNYDDNVNHFELGGAPFQNFETVILDGTGSTKSFELVRVHAAKTSELDTVFGFLILPVANAFNETTKLGVHNAIIDGVVGGSPADEIFAITGISSVGFIHASGGADIVRLGADIDGNVVAGTVITFTGTCGGSFRICGGAGRDTLIVASDVILKTGTDTIVEDIANIIHGFEVTGVPTTGTELISKFGSFTGPELNIIGRETSSPYKSISLGALSGSVSIAAITPATPPMGKLSASLARMFGEGVQNTGLEAHIHTTGTQSGTMTGHLLSFSGTARAASITGTGEEDIIMLGAGWSDASTATPADRSDDILALDSNTASSGVAGSISSGAGNDLILLYSARAGAPFAFADGTIIDSGAGGDIVIIAGARTIDGTLNSKTSQGEIDLGASSIFSLGLTIADEDYDTSYISDSTYTKWFTDIDPVQINLTGTTPEVVNPDGVDVLWITGHHEGRIDAGGAGSKLVIIDGGMAADSNAPANAASAGAVVDGEIDASSSSTNPHYISLRSGAYVSGAVGFSGNGSILEVFDSYAGSAAGTGLFRIRNSRLGQSSGNSISGSNHSDRIDISGTSTLLGGIRVGDGNDIISVTGTAFLHSINSGSGDDIVLLGYEYSIVDGTPSTGGGIFVLGNAVAETDITFTGECAIGGIRICGGEGTDTLLISSDIVLKTRAGSTDTTVENIVNIIDGFEFAGVPTPGNEAECIAKGHLLSLGQCIPPLYAAQCFSGHFYDRYVLSEDGCVDPIVKAASCLADNGKLFVDGACVEPTQAQCENVGYGFGTDRCIISKTGNFNGPKISPIGRNTTSPYDIIPLVSLSEDARYNALASAVWPLQQLSASLARMFGEADQNEDLVSHVHSTGTPDGTMTGSLLSLSGAAIATGITGTDEDDIIMLGVGWSDASTTGDRSDDTLALDDNAESITSGVTGLISGGSKGNDLILLYSARAEAPFAVADGDNIINSRSGGDFVIIAGSHNEDRTLNSKTSKGVINLANSTIFPLGLTIADADYDTSYIPDSAYNKWFTDIDPIRVNLTGTTPDVVNPDDVDVLWITGHHEGRIDADNSGSKVVIMDGDMVAGSGAPVNVAGASAVVVGEIDASNTGAGPNYISLRNGAYVSATVALSGNGSILEMFDSYAGFVEGTGLFRIHNSRLGQSSGNSISGSNRSERIDISGTSTLLGGIGAGDGNDIISITGTATLASIHGGNHDDIILLGYEYSIADDTDLTDGGAFTVGNRVAGTTITFTDTCETSFRICGGEGTDILIIASDVIVKIRSGTTDRAVDITSVIDGFEGAGLPTTEIESECLAPVRFFYAGTCLLLTIGSFTGPELNIAGRDGISIGALSDSVSFASITSTTLLLEKLSASLARMFGEADQNEGLTSHIHSTGTPNGTMTEHLLSLSGAARTASITGTGEDDIIMLGVGWSDASTSFSRADDTLTLDSDTANSGVTGSISSGTGNDLILLYSARTDAPFAVADGDIIVSDTGGDVVIITGARNIDGTLNSKTSKGEIDLGTSSIFSLGLTITNYATSYIPDSAYNKWFTDIDPIQINLTDTTPEVINPDGVDMLWITGHHEGDIDARDSGSKLIIVDGGLTAGSGAPAHAASAGAAVDGTINGWGTTPHSRHISVRNGVYIDGKISVSGHGSIIEVSDSHVGENLLTKDAALFRIHNSTIGASATSGTNYSVYASPDTGHNSSQQVLVSGTSTLLGQIGTQGGNDIISVTGTAVLHSIHGGDDDDIILLGYGHSIADGTPSTGGGTFTLGNVVAGTDITFTGTCASGGIRICGGEGEDTLIVAADIMVKTRVNRLDIPVASLTDIISGFGKCDATDGTATAEECDPLTTNAHTCIANGQIYVDGQCVAPTSAAQCYSGNLYSGYVLVAGACVDPVVQAATCLADGGKLLVDGACVAPSQTRCENLGYSFGTDSCTISTTGNFKSPKFSPIGRKTASPYDTIPLSSLSEDVKYNALTSAVWPLRHLSASLARLFGEADQNGDLVSNVRTSGTYNPLFGASLASLSGSALLGASFGTGGDDIIMLGVGWSNASTDDDRSDDTLVLDDSSATSRSIAEIFSAAGNDLVLLYSARAVAPFSNSSVINSGNQGDFIIIAGSHNPDGTLNSKTTQGAISLGASSAFSPGLTITDYAASYVPDSAYNKWFTDLDPLQISLTGKNVDVTNYDGVDVLWVTGYHGGVVGANGAGSKVILIDGSLAPASGAPASTASAGAVVSGAINASSGSASPHYISLRGGSYVGGAIAFSGNGSMLEMFDSYAGSVAGAGLFRIHNSRLGQSSGNSISGSNRSDRIDISGASTFAGGIVAGDGNDIISITGTATLASIEGGNNDDTILLGYGYSIAGAHDLAGGGTFTLGNAVAATDITFTGTCETSFRICGGEGTDTLIIASDVTLKTRSGTTDTPITDLTSIVSGFEKCGPDETASTTTGKCTTSEASGTVSGSSSPTGQTEGAGGEQEEEEETTSDAASEPDKPQPQSASPPVFGQVSGFENIIFVADLQLRATLMPAVQEFARKLTSGLYDMPLGEWTESQRVSLNGSGSMAARLAPGLADEINYQGEMSFVQHGVARDMGLFDFGTALYRADGVLESEDEEFRMTATGGALMMRGLLMRAHVSGMWVEAHEEEGIHEKLVAEGIQWQAGAEVSHGFAFGGVVVRPYATIWWQRADMKGAGFTYAGGEQHTSRSAGLEVSTPVLGKVRAGILHNGDKSRTESGSQWFTAEDVVEAKWSQLWTSANGVNLAAEAEWRQGQDTGREESQVRFLITQNF